jgi:ferritin-like metal-binding protein YciE
MNATEKVVQYLREAKATEDALVRVLQSQIAMTPSGEYRSALEHHLDQTRDHSRRVGDRIRELAGRRGPVDLAVGLTQEAAGQAIALAKTPLDLVRGHGGEEKVLKNAKDAAATETLEIATYAAIERLARAVGDERTEALAQSIRADEEDMLARVLRQIPQLTEAVVRAELHDDPSYDASRTGAADAVREVGDRAGDVVADASTASRRAARQARRVPGVAQAEGEAKGALADEDDLAIRNYDTLTADEITGRLADLSQVELAKVDAYERRGQNRTTVLDRIDALRGDEPWPGYDELNVGQVQRALADRTDDQVEATRRYETAHKNRTGVIRATERRLARA